LQLFAFRRRSEGDAHLAADQFLEQLACLRKSADALQVPALVEIGSVLLDGLAAPREIVLREEDRHQLVAALADLRPHFLERHPPAEVREGFLPGASVQIDGIDQRSVYVED